jgi:hypothetical protein
VRVRGRRGAGGEGTRATRRATCDGILLALQELPEDRQGVEPEEAAHVPVPRGREQARPRPVEGGLDDPERVEALRERAEALCGVTRPVEAERQSDRRGDRRDDDVAESHRTPPRAGPRVDLERPEGLHLGVAPEPDGGVLLLDGPGEVPVIASPVAREETHRRAEGVWPREEIERPAAPARDEGGEELSSLEGPEDDGVTIGADRVERPPHHRVGRERNAVEASRPALERAFEEHLAHDGDEREGLYEEIVPLPRARPEPLHAFVERPGVRRDDPVRVVRRGELGEWDGPGSRGRRASLGRVEDLAETRAVVDHEEPAARTRELALARGARVRRVAPRSDLRAEEVEKSLPVLGGESLEADVRREHAATIAWRRGGRALRASAMPGVTAASLFEAYFAPLYPEDVLSDLARARSTDANPAKNPALFAHIEDASLVFARMAPKLFADDDPRLDRSDASVHRLSRVLTRARRDAWSREGAAGTAQNQLFNVVVHGAAYVGACVVLGHAGVWSLRRPLWESVVTLESRAGRGDLAVFQWWLKSLADDALEGDGGEETTGALTLADRYRTHVEIPCASPEALPILAEPRPLPRLAKVRYDALHRHLRAHLPELRDLGEHFPSPERFDAYAFTALDFLLLGGGRMLLVVGTNAEGVHLFWLGAAGFEKAMFFPADAFPAPVVRASGDKLVVVTEVEGKPARHELLWWGP